MLTLATTFMAGATLTGSMFLTPVKMSLRFALPAPLQCPGGPVAGNINEVNLDDTIYNSHAAALAAVNAEVAEAKTRKKKAIEANCPEKCTHYPTIDCDPQASIQYTVETGTPVPIGGGKYKIQTDLQGNFTLLCHCPT